MKRLKLIQNQKSLLIILIGSCLIGYHAIKLNRSVVSDVEAALPTHNLIAAKTIDPIVSSKIEELNSIAKDEMNLDQKTEVFQAKLDELRICLELEKASSESLKPNFDNLYQFIMNDFGNSFSQLEEWSNTHMTLANGDERRIRIEIEATSEEKAGKKLSYFSLDSEKLPLRMEIDPELAKEPADIILQKLTSEGKVTFKENASRAYFASGNQIYYTEKNGILSDLEIQNSTGRIFKCYDMTSAENHCRCL